MSVTSTYDIKKIREIFNLALHGGGGKVLKVGSSESYTTVQSAVNAASAGDIVLVSPGDYDEAVSITKDNITIIGLGARGAAAIAPSASNGVAITIDGTGAGGRVEEVSLVNIGGEGNGTGGGLHVKGDIRRIRAEGCKFEGGAFGVKLESTAQGAVGDVRIEDCEIAWATDGVLIDVSGAGDPVTQVYIRHCLFHNQTTDCVRNATTNSADIWIDGNTFAGQEDGTEPTQFLDIDETATTGFVCNNVFATTVFSTAKFAIASGVLFANNVSQAENPSAAVGGTAGRPD